MSIQSKIKSMKRIIIDSDFRFQFLSDKKISRNIPDKQFLERYYKIKLKKDLNLEDPKLFTEKLQWLKLYDHRDVYTQMVDKAGAKEYVAKRVGEEYVIPTLGIWDNFDEIDFDILPSQFVLKCTHDSGSIVICKDKNSFDIEKAKRKIEKGLKQDFYYVFREWPYKNVKPRIIAEKYMETEHI